MMINLKMWFVQLLFSGLYISLVFKKQCPFNWMPTPPKPTSGEMGVGDLGPFLLQFCSGAYGAVCGIRPIYRTLRPAPPSLALGPVPGRQLTNIRNRS